MRRLLLIALLTSGCAGIPVQLKIDALAEDEGQAQLEQLGASLVEGALDEGTGAERQVRLENMADGLTAEVLARAGAELTADLGPRARQQLGMAVREAIAAAGEPGARADLRRITSSATDAVVATLGQGVAEELGPILAEVFQERLGPALAAGLDPEQHPAVGAAVEGLARSAGDGLALSLDGALGEAIAVQRAALTHDVTTWMDSGRVAAERAAGALGMAFGGAAIALVLAVVLLVRATRRTRGAFAALDLVASQIGAARDREEVRRVAASVKRVGEGTRGGRVLSARLEDQPFFKIDGVADEFPQG